MASKERRIYCTTFCNFAHYEDTGRPIAHECYIIPAPCLQIEREHGPSVALESEAWRRFYADKGRPVIGRKLRAPTT
jgi:hypothetical protein